LLMMAILTGVRWNLSVVLICISFIAIFSSSHPGPQSSYFILPTTTEMTGTWYNTQLFSVDMGGLTNFLPTMAWNCDPPDLSLSCSLRWQVHTAVLSYWLRWGLQTSCPGWPWTTILLILTSQIAKFTEAWATRALFF
jgi:hypothetical protein